MNKNEHLTPVVTKIDFIRRPHIKSDCINPSGKYEIIFNVGKTFETLYFSPGTCFFSEKIDKDKSFEQTLELFIPGQSDETSNLLSELSFMYGVYRFTYNNGTIKIVGSKKIPANLLFEFSTKQNGYKVTITCKSLKKAVEPA